MACLDPKIVEPAEAGSVLGVNIGLGPEADAVRAMCTQVRTTMLPCCVFEHTPLPACCACVMSDDR